MAQEPVARIVDIKFTRPNPPIRNYVRGQFMPVSSERMIVGPVQTVPAVVIRYTGRVHASIAHVDQFLNIGEVIKTGPETLMTIEFLVGGRVSINSSACVEITSERSVADEVPSWAKVFKTLFAKPNQQLEIQTNGGIMGIRG